MTESAVLVGDVALPADAKVRFTHRDGVGLDEHKVASPRQNMTLRRRSAARLTPL